MSPGHGDLSQPIRISQHLVTLLPRYENTINVYILPYSLDVGKQGVFINIQHKTFRNGKQMSGSWFFPIGGRNVVPQPVNIIMPNSNNPNWSFIKLLHWNLPCVFLPYLRQMAKPKITGTSLLSYALYKVLWLFSELLKSLGNHRELLLIKVCIRILQPMTNENRATSVCYGL